jgi:hypothetical protein
MSLYHQSYVWIDYIGDISMVHWDSSSTALTVLTNMIEKHKSTLTSGMIVKIGERQSVLKRNWM